MINVYKNSITIQWFHKMKQSEISYTPDDALVMALVVQNFSHGSEIKISAIHSEDFQNYQTFGSNVAT